VTATYSRREDGGIEVVNRGYDASSGEWEEAVGKAYFVVEPDVARLKVSFFGPFYGAYNVVRLDDAYGWSMVVGPDRSYLWILARQPTLDPATRERLVRTAAELGFPVDELIWVAHDLRPDPDR
jgi:apolipoprotein D and lipocalin family protein